MTSGSAVFAALLLYAIGALPLGWLAIRAGRAGGIAVILGALLLALALFQTGIFNRASFASTKVENLVRADTAESRCQQVVKVLVDNGVLLANPGAQGVVVKGTAWDQLPPLIREAVMNCAQSAAGGQSSGDIPVIRR